jgi:hypothetical protein
MKNVLLSFVVALLTFSGAAFATPPDVSSVVTAIEETATPVNLIGAAVLILLIAVKVWKWLRRAS